MQHRRISSPYLQTAISDYLAVYKKRVYYGIPDEIVCLYNYISSFLRLDKTASLLSLPVIFNLCGDKAKEYRWKEDGWLIYAKRRHMGQIRVLQPSISHAEEC